jgi:ZIP family zinc transporter
LKPTLSITPQPWRRRALYALCGGAALIAAIAWITQLRASQPLMFMALLGGGAAALATAFGTLPVLLSASFSRRRYAAFLGFGAGIMLAACAFSLVLPALHAARESGLAPLTAAMCVGAGIIGGAALLLLLDRSTASSPSPLPVDETADSLRRAWLFVFAVTLHNLPEGLAIGVAYAGIDPRQAHILAAGISIQDIPEGLVVALALRGVGYSRIASAGYGVVSGLIEPVAALAGVALIGVSASLLPWGLAAAAGAMLFVLVHDVIPETHRHGNGTLASCGVIGGFVLMAVLDTAFA